MEVSGSLKKVVEGFWKFMEGYGMLWKVLKGREKNILSLS